MKFEDKNLFSTDPEHVSRIHLTIGLLSIALAFMNFFYPNPETQSTGRWSWVYRGITEEFGAYGYPFFQAVIGLAFIVWSRRKSKKT
jgi:uncharacterized membrane protein